MELRTKTTFLLSFSVLAATEATAQITWAGATSGNWNTSVSWDRFRVPDGTEVVDFPASGANKAATVSMGLWSLTWGGCASRSAMTCWASQVRSGYCVRTKAVLRSLTTPASAF